MNGKHKGDIQFEDDDSYEEGMDIDQTQNQTRDPNGNTQGTFSQPD